MRAVPWGEPDWAVQRAGQAASVTVVMLVMTCDDTWSCVVACDDVIGEVSPLGSYRLLGFKLF